MTTHVVILPDLSATRAFGVRLGESLFPGAVVALIGQLGAGKTHLTRAIAEGLGVPEPRVVTSPTFVLIQEYDGRWPVYHFDVYRLPNEAAFADLGAHEYLEGDGVCLIEWADRVASALPPCLRVTLEVAGEHARRATLEAGDERYASVVAALRGASL